MMSYKGSAQSSPMNARGAAAVISRLPWGPQVWHAALAIGSRCRAHSGRLPALPPKVPKPVRRQLGVANRMLNILVAKVGL
jgi:hypothetical protein